MISNNCNNFWWMEVYPEKCTIHISSCTSIILRYTSIHWKNITIFLKSHLNLYKVTKHFDIIQLLTCDQGNIWYVGPEDKILFETKAEGKTLASDNFRRNWFWTKLIRNESIIRNESTCLWSQTGNIDGNIACPVKHWFIFVHCFNY